MPYLTGPQEFIMRPILPLSLLLLLAACARGPVLQDAELERGTALPPPGVTMPR